MKKLTAFLLISLSWTVIAQPKEFPVRTVLNSFVANKTLGGCIAVVATKSDILTLETTGFAGLDKKKPIRPNTMFWIASITKPMVAVCVLQLQEAGKLSIDDPVEKHLPEFASQWMIESADNGKLALKKPARPITIRDLLTHTSGLTTPDAPRPESTLAELAMAYSKTPLEFEPGSRWKYSNAGSNLLGRIVEITSGKSFANYFQENVLDACGMKNTTFWPTQTQTKRIATSYVHTGDGKLLPTHEIFLKGGLTNRKRTPFPRGGLYSTATDVVQFYQMMLNDGMYKGKRVLTKDSVALMTHNQTGNLKTGFFDGLCWGLGFGLIKTPNGMTAALSPGTYGHGGGLATLSYADPKTGRIVVMLPQYSSVRVGDISGVLKKHSTIVTELMAAVQKQHGR
tara:strand:- start:475 stop:1668 length:1194 start_codon:yes stop_codon:yes gene_type:complete